MRWKGERQSSNVEDRRGETPTYAAAGGGGLFLLLRIFPLLLRTKGGRILLVVGAVAFFGAQYLGIDIFSLLGGGGVQQNSTNRAEIRAQDQELVGFVGVVLGDTETTWHEKFQQMGRQYREPKLVLFSGAVNSACGLGRAAMGPFYCPSDQKVYIDLSFYRDLKNRHNAPGDFAQAYVIAHEVGHHVQNLLGISEQVHSQQQRLDSAGANALSVRLELQADCLAGVWGHSANVERELLDPGDLNEALNAATAIGDDRLQKEGQGYVVPESFTHGTSEQRRSWFNRGFTTGDINTCDTFGASKL